MYNSDTLDDDMIVSFTYVDTTYGENVIPNGIVEVTLSNGDKLHSKSKERFEHDYCVELPDSKLI